MFKILGFRVWGFGFGILPFIFQSLTYALSTLTPSKPQILGSAPRHGGNVKSGGKQQSENSNKSLLQPPVTKPELHSTMDCKHAPNLRNDEENLQMNTDVPSIGCERGKLHNYSNPAFVASAR